MENSKPARHCSLDDCSMPLNSGGLCKQHYDRRRYLEGKGRSKSRRNKKRSSPSGERLVFYCSFPDCGKEDFNRGLCAGHYYQVLRGNELKPLFQKDTCEVPGCENVFASRKGLLPLCRKHVDFKRRFNLPLERIIELHENPHCENPGCGETENLHLDHDHACCPRGKEFPVKSQKSCGECVRGWLCRNCNIALGLLFEDRERIVGLASYLPARI